MKQPFFKYCIIKIGASCYPCDMKDSLRPWPIQTFDNARQAARYESNSTILPYLAFKQI